MDQTNHAVFSKSLINFFKDFDPNKICSLFTEELYNDLIFFFIKMITTLERSVSEEYTKALAELVRILSNHKISLSDTVIDYVVNFGKSGKSSIEKRFCIFFCSTLIQIQKKNNKDLIDNFVLLHSDKEKAVKREVAFQLRFVLKVNNQEFFNNYLSKITNKFIFDEPEIGVQIEAIISVLENYDKVYEDDNFSKKLIEVLINLVSSNSIEKPDYLKKITKLVQALMKISKENIKVAQVLEKDVNTIFQVFIKHIILLTSLLLLTLL